MIEFIKKYWGYLAMFIGGLLVFLLTPTKVLTKTDPFGKIIKKKEDEVAEIDDKLQKLKEDGVEDLTPEQEVDYWKKN
jgi:hypothetical protein